MDALARLQDLYTQRDNLNEQISKVEELLGADPAEPKQRRTRGPNKPKEQKETKLATPTL
jgi:hypothetical protein